MGFLSCVKRFEVSCGGAYFRFLNIRNSYFYLVVFARNDALCFWWDIMLDAYAIVLGSYR